MTLMNQKLNLSRTLIFALIFIGLTIIGTLSHESGHYIAGKLFKFNPTLHYGMVSYDGMMLLKNDIHLKEKNLIATIAGPLHTVMTGILGLMVLFINRKKRKEKGLSNIDWTGVFLSLFWLRECFNLFIFSIMSIYTKQFSITGDEAFISFSLGFSPMLLNAILGVIGLAVCSYVVFMIVPKEDRFNLIFGGFLGSIVGFIVWFYFLGKIVLP